MSRSYSFVYKELVKDDGDIVGIIAYYLYKNEKKKFIENYIESKGKEPTEKEIEKFCDTHRSATVCTGLRMQAEKILAQFSSAIIDQQKEKLEIYYKTLHIETVKVAIEEDRKENHRGWKKVGTFFKHVGIHAAASAFIVIALYLLLLLKAGEENGEHKMLSNLVQPKTHDTVKSNAARIQDTGKIK